MSQTTNFTRGNISEQITTFSIPFIIGGFFMQFYNYIDAIIVGKYIGKEALAGVGAASPIIFITLSIISGFAIGGTIIISKYFAKNEINNCKKASFTMLSLLILLGVIITIILWHTCDNIIEIIKLPYHIKQLTYKYLLIYTLGTAPTIGYTLLTAILRGVGNSTTPLYFLITTSILNIVLDIIFVLYFNYGIEGVAWASVIAQTIAFISLLFYINIKVPHLSISRENLKFDLLMARESIKLGGPAAIQQFVVSFGYLTIISIVTMFGTDVLAAYASATRILILIMILPSNFSLALVAFTAQNHSVKNIKRIKNALKITLRIAITISFTVLIVISMFSTSIMQTFTNDINIINIGKQYLLVIALTFWIFFIMSIYNGVIKGLGHTLVPMIITIITLWLVKIPIAYSLSNIYGEFGIWLSEPISWSISLILSILYYNFAKNKE